MENKNRQLTNMSDAINRISVTVNNGFQQREREGIWDSQAWRQLAEAGVHGAFLPSGSGGHDLDYHDYGALLQALGYHSKDNGLNFSIMAHSLACLWPLHLHAKTALIREMIPLFASGRYILSNAITEAQGGSDVYNMQTTAVKEGNHYILNGSKSFCSNGPVATHVLVYALTSPGRGFMGGISAFLVPMDAKNVKKGKNFDKMGLRTATSSVIDFEGVIVSEDYLVGPAGAGGMIFQESMVFEKTYMAAAHTGTLQRWLEHMCQYARERQSGGQALVKHQAVAHTLAEVKILLETGRAVVSNAFDLLAGRNLSAKITYSAIVKEVVSRAMHTAGHEYMGLFAGEGYKTHTGIEVQVRDFMASGIYSGTGSIQKNIIASGLIV